MPLVSSGCAYPAAPWPTRRGGARACCTRSTRARSRTPTATGSGTCAGSLARLDHLEWLGVDGIWLNPTMPSPNDDWGYDVADYTAVHPDLGTLEDLDALVAAAGARGIRVLLDLVPNHTSDRHGWFVDALGGRDAPHRDFYVWADPAPGGGPPNNWRSNFGGARVDARRAERPVLPAQLPPEPAGPQLVERRGPRRLRRDPALLVRPRDRGLPDRRLPRDRQGPRAARRPGGDARRPPRGAAAPGAPGLLDEPPGGPRRPAPLARAVGRRGPRSRARRRDLRARPRPADAVLRQRERRAEPRLQLPLRPRAARRRAAADDRRGRRGAAAGGRLAGVGGLEPRRAAARDALGRRRPGARPCRAADAADPARDAVPLLRRRARAARRAVRSARGQGPGRAAHRRPGGQPRRLPHADAVERRARRRLHRAGRDAVAGVRGPRRAQRGGPARRSRRRRCTWCAT